MVGPAWEGLWFEVRSLHGLGSLIPLSSRNPTLPMSQLYLAHVASPLVEPMKGGLLWRGATHEAQQSLCTHAPDSSATRGSLRRTHDRWHWRWPRPAAQSGPNRPQPQGVIVRRYLLLPRERPGAGRRVVQLRRGERSHQSEAASNQHSAVRQQCRRVKPASLHQVAGRRPGTGRRIVRLG